MKKAKTKSVFTLLTVAAVLSIGLLTVLTSCNSYEGTAQTHEHILGEWQTETPPGCVEEGLEFRQCTIEGCLYRVYEETAATGHTLGEWETDVDATCTEDGVKKKSCRNCDYYIEEPIYSTGLHSYDVNGQCKHCRAGLVYRFDETSNAYFVAKFTGNGEITVPAIYNGKKVIGIDESAFENCRDVEKVTLAQGIEIIGESAFRNCSALSEITVPDTVTQIGRYSFRNTAWFDSLPDGILYIGKIAYQYVGNRTESSSVVIEEGTETIAPYAFTSQRWISGINVPDTVKTIGDSAFYNCTGLSSLKLGSGIKSIGADAFVLCNALTTVNIADLAVWCGISFANADSNPMNYADRLNINGNQITGELIIPDGVTCIPDGTFKNCSAIVSVQIPDGVSRVGDHAFEDCNRLSDISAPDSLTEIGEDAFLGTEWYAQRANGIVFLGKTIYCYKGLPQDNSLTIPEGTLAIASGAFTNLASLRSVYIPKSVVKIAADAFAGCGKLQDIVIADENQHYSDNGNCIVEKKSKTLIRGCNSTVIPNDGSVTKIGEYAFFGCSGLTEIVLPGGITEIGRDAFGFCTRLTSVTIPASVEHINYDAFYNCSEIADIYFGGTKEEFLKTAVRLSNCSENLTVHCSDGNLDRDGNDV